MIIYRGYLKFSKSSTISDSVNVFVTVRQILVQEHSKPQSPIPFVWFLPDSHSDCDSDVRESRPKQIQKLKEDVIRRKQSLCLLINKERFSKRRSQYIYQDRWAVQPHLSLFVKQWFLWCAEVPRISCGYLAVINGRDLKLLLGF